MAVEYQREGKIGIFTINLPEQLNAMNLVNLEQFSEALINFRDDDSVWVGIVTGVGDRAFCTGAGIKDYLPWAESTIRGPWKRWPDICRGLELWKPMIAAINGAALGGGLEISLACDLRIASENASFGVPEVLLGLIPGWGGTQRLPRAIPRAWAAELLLTGRPIDAQQAYRIGLVNRVVPVNELMPTAKKMAEYICAAGPLAVRAAKQAMIRGIELPLKDGLDIEYDLVADLMKTEDYKEGRQAFMEKRAPVFKCK